MIIKELRQLAKTQGFWAENAPLAPFKALSTPCGFVYKNAVYRKISPLEAFEVQLSDPGDSSIRRQFEGLEMVAPIQPTTKLVSGSHFYRNPVLPQEMWGERSQLS